MACPGASSCPPKARKQLTKKVSRVEEVTRAAEEDQELFDELSQLERLEELAAAAGEEENDLLDIDEDEEEGEDPANIIDPEALLRELLPGLGGHSAIEEFGPQGGQGEDQSELDLGGISKASGQALFDQLMQLEAEEEEAERREAEQQGQPGESTGDPMVGSDGMNGKARPDGGQTGSAATVSHSKEKMSPVAFTGGVRERVHEPSQRNVLQGAPTAHPMHAVDKPKKKMSRFKASRQ